MTGVKNTYDSEYFVDFDSRLVFPMFGFVNGRHVYEGTDETLWAQLTA